MSEKREWKCASTTTKYAWVLPDGSLYRKPGRDAISPTITDDDCRWDCLPREAVPVPVAIEWTIREVGK